MAKEKKRKLKKQDAKKGSWRFPKEIFVYSDDEGDSVDDMVDHKGERYFNAEIERRKVAEDLPPDHTRRVAKYVLVEEGEITNTPQYNPVKGYDPNEDEG
jgi:hypothetical protein